MAGAPRGQPTQIAAADGPRNHPRGRDRPVQVLESAVTPTYSSVAGWGLAATRGIDGRLGRRTLHHDIDDRAASFDLERRYEPARGSWPARLVSPAPGDGLLGVTIAGRPWSRREGSGRGGNVSAEPAARFFVNSGIVSGRMDMHHLLRPLLKQTIPTATTGRATLVTHGAGWVERIVVDQPGVCRSSRPCRSASTSTPGRPRVRHPPGPARSAYTLVQGDERVTLEFSPRCHGPDEPVQQSLRLVPLSQYIQMELSVARRPRVRGPADGRPDEGPAEALTWASRVGRPCSIPRDVRAHPATRRAARHLGPDARHALPLDRRDGAGGIASRASADSGLAHFMEHITFRGTQRCHRRGRSRRPSKALAVPPMRPRTGSPPSTG